MAAVVLTPGAQVLVAAMVAVWAALLLWARELPHPHQLMWQQQELLLL